MTLTTNEYGDRLTELVVRRADLIIELCKVRDQLEAHLQVHNQDDDWRPCVERWTARVIEI